MEFTDEAFLTQLEYHPNEMLLEQLQRIKKNTNNFNGITKHIVQLNEQLKPYDSFVSLSNTHDYVKIKNQADSKLQNEVTEIIKHWSEKYKIDLEKIVGKETYYILGYEK